MYSELLFHRANRGPYFQVFLFLLQIVSGAMLAVGWYTKLSCVVSWILLNSLQVSCVLVFAEVGFSDVHVSSWPLGRRLFADNSLLVHVPSRF